MTCPPKLADLNRTVIEAIPVDRSNGWWTGLVRDRYTPTGELRLRLERYPPGNPKNRPEHIWRIRTDFWETEREAVKIFERKGGKKPSGVLPISDFYTVKEGSRFERMALDASLSSASRRSGDRRATVSITGTQKMTRSSRSGRSGSSGTA